MTAVSSRPHSCALVYEYCALCFPHVSTWFLRAFMVMPRAVHVIPRACHVTLTLATWFLYFRSVFFVVPQIVLRPEVFVCFWYSFPPFYAKRSNRTVDLFKRSTGSIRSCRSLKRSTVIKSIFWSQKTIDSIEKLMIEFPTLLFFAYHCNNCFLYTLF